MFQVLCSIFFVLAVIGSASRKPRYDAFDPPPCPNDGARQCPSDLPSLSSSPQVRAGLVMALLVREHARQRIELD